MLARARAWGRPRRVVLTAGVRARSQNSRLDARVHPNRVVHDRGEPSAETAGTSPSDPSPCRSWFTCRQPVFTVPDAKQAHGCRSKGPRARFRRWPQRGEGLTPALAPEVTRGVDARSSAGPTSHRPRSDRPTRPQIGPVAARTPGTPGSWHISLTSIPLRQGMRQVGGRRRSQSFRRRLLVQARIPWG